MKKLVTFILAITLSLITSVGLVKAKSNQKDEYIYSYWGEPIPSATGLAHRQSYDSDSLGIILRQPSDIYAYQNKLYIVDASENSLIILDENFNVLVEEKLFAYASDEEQTTTLNTPNGVSVTDDAIYIADTKNNRILKLNHELEVVETIGTPDEQTFTRSSDPVVFEPLKVDVDSNGRIYVIAQNVYEGIIELSSDGTFNRYTGVNPVSVSLIDIIRRQLATEEQLSKMSLFLPTTFKNLTIDDRNFIFATAAPSSRNDNLNMIKEINPKGVNVLKTNGYHIPQGDVVYYQLSTGKVPSGPSDLVDITVNNSGMYTVLDQKRGRLFTYDHEGRLLYISADAGTQQGKLEGPVALTYFGELIIVLDKAKGSLEIFGPTIFGELVNEAIRLQYNGEFDASYEIWKEVTKLNSNYEIAYIGIGKSLLNEKKYREAMRNFKLGNDKKYYSKALEGYRKELLTNNFNWIMTGVAIIGVLALAKPVVNFFRGEKEEE